MEITSQTADFVFALFSQRRKIAENNKNVQRMTLNSKGLFSQIVQEVNTNNRLFISYFRVYRPLTPPYVPFGIQRFLTQV